MGTLKESKLGRKDHIYIYFKFGNSRRKNIANVYDNKNDSVIFYVKLKD